jgi:FtsP/CotA-like multicopper oxidase with cupredoxin domain
VTDQTVFEDIKLGVGQRTDVIVETSAHENKPFFIRVQSPDRPCANTIQPNATAIAYFDNPNVVPTTSPWPSFVAAIQDCENEALEKTEPLYPYKLPAPPAATHTFVMTLEQNETGSYLFRMNNSAFRVNFNHPILLLSNLGNNSYPYDPQWNVDNLGGATSVRLILYNQNERSHPMHLHGHNYFVEAVGYNSQNWDGTIVRPANPQRRDTQIVPAWGYLVISFETDNPGAWVFHCHVAWHVATGLSATFVERPDKIAQFRVPNTIAQTCRDWWSYTNTTVVDQIDSGL